MIRHTKKSLELEPVRYTTYQHKSIWNPTKDVILDKPDEIAPVLDPSSEDCKNVSFYDLDMTSKILTSRKEFLQTDSTEVLMTTNYILNRKLGFALAYPNTNTLNMIDYISRFQHTSASEIYRGEYDFINNTNRPLPTKMPRYDILIYMDLVSKSNQNTFYFTNYFREASVILSDRGKILKSGNTQKVDESKWIDGYNKTIERWEVITLGIRGNNIRMSGEKMSHPYRHWVHFPPSKRQYEEWYISEMKDIPIIGANIIKRFYDLYYDNIIDVYRQVNQSIVPNPVVIGYLKNSIPKFTLISVMMWCYTASHTTFDRPQIIRNDMFEMFVIEKNEFPRYAKIYDAFSDETLSIIHMTLMGCLQVVVNGIVEFVQEQITVCKTMMPIQKEDGLIHYKQVYGQYYELKHNFPKSNPVKIDPLLYIDWVLERIRKSDILQEPRKVAKNTINHPKLGQVKEYELVVDQDDFNTEWQIVVMYFELCGDLTNRYEKSKKYIKDGISPVGRLAYMTDLEYSDYASSKICTYRTFALMMKHVIIKHHEFISGFYKNVILVSHIQRGHIEHAIEMAIKIYNKLRLNIASIRYLKNIERYKEISTTMLIDINNTDSLKQPALDLTDEEIEHLRKYIYNFLPNLYDYSNRPDARELRNNMAMFNFDSTNEDDKFLFYYNCIRMYYAVGFIFQPKTFNFKFHNTDTEDKRPMMYDFSDYEGSNAKYSNRRNMGLYDPKIVNDMGYVFCKKSTNDIIEQLDLDYDTYKNYGVFNLSRVIGMFILEEFNAFNDAITAYRNDTLSNANYISATLRSKLLTPANKMMMPKSLNITKTVRKKTPKSFGLNVFKKK